MKRTATFRHFTPMRLKLWMLALPVAFVLLPLGLIAGFGNWNNMRHHSEATLSQSHPDQ
jgi:hypothetical protein